MSTRRDFFFVIVISTIIAAASARPFADGWNDGSRLATIECLVDFGTFAIDESMFVLVPSDHSPYTPYDPTIHRTGTLDKMLVNGRFYSDKPPVPAVISASLYKGLQLSTGLKARENSALFCWLMHFFGAGVPFVVAVGCTFLLAHDLGLPRQLSLLLAGGFATATIALPYAKGVNAHILLLAVASSLLLLMGRTARRLDTPGHRFPLWHWLAIGILSGFAYTIDLGGGPIICLGVGGWTVYRLRGERGWRFRSAAIAVLGFAALPAPALHHAVIFSINGTLNPAITDPAVFQWPGSPFYAGNMTGRWNHPTTLRFLLYSLDILFGQRGFYSNNLMLYLGLVGLIPLLRTKFREKPEVLCGVFWCTGIYLMYATLSMNYSGACVSIRWFVPLLAPWFFALGLILRRRPDYAYDFLILAGWNSLWILPAWGIGPWNRPPVWLTWIVLAGGLTHWGIHELRRRARAARTTVPTYALAPMMGKKAA